MNLKGYAFCRRSLSSSQLPFGGLVASWGTIFVTSGAGQGSILTPWAEPRGPREQQDGHEVVQNRIVIDFVETEGPHFKSFWAPRLGF